MITSPAMRTASGASRGDFVMRSTGVPHDPSDEEMLGRSAAGDVDALGVLYDRHRVAAYSLALRITGEPSLAEDAVQEAFLGVWRNAARYAPDRGAVRTWLLSIVHHRAIDAIRRRRQAAELPGADDPLPASLTIPDVWQAVAGHLDREVVLAALERVSPAQREVLELAYFGGLTQQEIAAHLHAPLGTVKSRARLGLLALRTALLALEQAEQR